MTAAELQLEHSVELEVIMNGKKTTLLSGIEQVVGNTVLLTPIQVNEKLVGFPPNCMVNLLYAGEKQVFCWKNVKIKAVRYEKKVFHCAELVGDAEVLNRRGSYRVFVGEEMLLTSFSANGPKTYRVHLKDISESGMAFLSKEEFMRRIDENDFLEYDEHFGNYYGTPKSFVEETLKTKSVIMEIDVVGALNAKKFFPDCVLVMILPPSLEELKNRLVGRGTEGKDEIENRLSRLEYEVSQKDKYDYLIVNDDLETAIADVCKIIDGE